MIYKERGGEGLEEKTMASSGGIKQIAERFEKTRKALNAIDFILMLIILVPLVLIFKTFPYGFYISFSALALKMFLWRPIRNRWKREYLEAQTKINWERQGVKVKYEPVKGIDEDLLRKYDLALNKTAQSYMSKEKISAEFKDSYFEASDFVITYKSPKDKIKSRYTYLAGVWMSFTFKNHSFPDIRLKKKENKKNIFSGGEISKLLDNGYDNYGIENLQNNKRHILREFLSAYDEEVFVITDQFKIYLIFEGLFINKAPNIKEEISEKNLTTSDFAKFPKIYKFVQNFAVANDEV